MGFELLAENSRDRREQLDTVLSESREQALQAVRMALNQQTEADSAITGDDRRRDLVGARQRGTWLSRDAMSQQVVAGGRARAARGAALQQSINRFDVEIHKKLAITLACLVFVLMGPPLALRFPSAGVGFAVSASALIFFVHWVGLLGGESLADRRVADPAITMWLGNVIFFIIGVYLLSRMGHSFGTNRSGGMGEKIAGFFGASNAASGSSS
jgi:lipopolysaccharide export LptBFGC system permease protein LptF